MNQMAFTDMEYSNRRKKTKREEFLDAMDTIIPLTGGEGEMSNRFVPWRGMVSAMMIACKEIFCSAKGGGHPAYRTVKSAGLPYFIWNFGEKNSDKVIYFITDISGKISGVYSLYLSILAEMSFACAMGWIPVVDDTPQLLRRNTLKYRKGKNVINEYFELNNPISVEEALQSRYVVTSVNCNDGLALKFAGKDQESYKVRKKTWFYCKDFELDYWREFASKNLLYKKELQDELEKAYHEVIGDKDSVLGIAVREGKMYLTPEQRKKLGEYKQPTVDEIIDCSHKYMKLWGCKYIYLSCETDEVIELFIKEFSKSKVLYLQRNRWPLYECCFKTKNVNRVSKKQKTESRDDEYMKDMYILSKCESAILPINCGTEAMYIKGAGQRNFLLME